MGNVLSDELIGLINNSSPAMQAAMVGTRLDEALGGVLADGSVSVSELDSGVSVAVAVEDAKTTSQEENIAGLSSAITLANSLKTVLNAHGADAAEHSVAADTFNFPVATADATDLTTLLALSGDLLTAYDTHDADAEAVTPSYHGATEAGDHSLASAVAPTDLQEAVTRLNDLKAKYNAHDADSTAHTTGGTHQEATADAAYGAAILVPVTGVLSGDRIQWSVIDGGSGSVTGVSAVAGAGTITFTFSADPQNDAIVSYTVYRPGG